MNIVLYHSPDSRSSRLIWLLEELAIPFDLVYCTIRRRNGLGDPDPRNPHPDKRVPAMIADGELVTEGAAIALFLTDAVQRLGPCVGQHGRADYLTWLMFYAGEIEPAFSAFRNDELQSDRFKELAWQRVVQRVGERLQRGPFLLGDQFSAADILLSGPFEWIPEFGGKYHSICDWVQRLQSRPAMERALRRDSPTA